ncbi:YheC/YheD family protein [Paenibacillus sp. SGZ-1009]|uniref:YheC/YheD family protein n=1 Tax=Paenibacillus campi TaxID=3106031 RepID=UPI002AFDE3D6|nr:YheC/YheD family protein [Paenibacillus sp. SGZ-1009]
MTDIGVYHAAHPLKTLPPARIRALVDAAQQRDVRLLFFDESSFDAQQRTVQAMVPDPDLSDHWLVQSHPLPDIVINEMAKLPAERSVLEQKLNRLVTFTSHSIHSKMRIQHELSQSTAWSSLVIPTIAYTGSDSLLTMLTQEQDIILKPDQGRQGKQIVRITKTDKQSLIWRSGDTVLQVAPDGLQQLAQSLIGEQPFLVQRYIDSTTEQRQPFDCRLHIQRDQHGQFVITRIYVRYGQPDAVTSNLEQGGQTADWMEWLYRYRAHIAEQSIAQLPELGIRLACYIDDLYDYQLDELGIDLAVDAAGKWWFYEANTAPQTREHEAERAVHTIGYAQHLAQRHLLLNELPQLQTEQTVIGLLAIPNAEESELIFVEACSAVARLHEAIVVRIDADDIFYAQQRLRGYVWEQSQWVAYCCPYPDVLFDRLKKRGIAAYSRLYSELAHIPATHELKSGSMSKLHIYRLLQQAPASVRAVLIPFYESNRADDVLSFIDQHHNTVLKPDTGSHGQHIFNIKRQAEGYEVYDQSYLHTLGANELRQLVGMTIGQGYILQRFVESSTSEGHPFHLRVHVMKKADRSWEVVFIQPYVAVSTYRKVTNHEQTLRLSTKWSWLLHTQYGQQPGDALDSTIRELAATIATYVEPLLKRRFPEIAIDLGIDKQQNIWLFEANFNRIGNSFHPFEVAKYAIPYAVSLAQQSSR